MIATLDLNHKTFVIHIAALNISSNTKIYFLKRAQIAYKKVDKAFIKVSDINDHIIR